MLRTNISAARSRAGFFLTVLFAASAAIAQPEKISTSFAAITKKVEPAVVSIHTKGKPQQVAAARPGEPENDMMEFLRRQMQQRPPQVVGSGFIVDKSGHIITNAHVVAEALKIMVKLDSGEEFAAIVVGTDVETDIAVLKINTRRDLPVVKLGDSDKAEVGDWVLAIGSPFDLAKTVTAGIISQTRRQTPYGSVFQRFIQTDAAINRGNSGGPLVNMDGEVIGVNSQIATSTGDYNGVGFALPSREAEYVYAQIVRHGKVRRGYLGVLLDSVQSEFANVYAMKDTRGAIIIDMRDKRGPAAIAGLQVGDVITQFDGQRVENAQDLISRISSGLPDQAVTLTYLREVGASVESKTVSVKLGERPSSRVAVDEGERRVLPVDDASQKPFGLTLAVLTPTAAAANNFEGKKGLIIRDISPSSFISDVKNSAGGYALVEGDLIQRINRVEVNDLKTFSDLVVKLKPGDPVVMHVVFHNPTIRAPQLKIVQFTVR